MVYFKGNLKNVLLMFVVCTSLNCALGNMEGFMRCIKAVNTFFGARASVHDCLKNIIKNTIASDVLDSEIKSYKFDTIINNKANCDKILLQEDFCSRRAFSSTSSIGSTQIDRSHKLQAKISKIKDKCKSETEKFGKDEFEIFLKAVDNHKLGPLKLSFPDAENPQVQYYIHQPGSHGEAYLIHISDVVTLPQSLDPYPFCHLKYNIP